MIICITLYVLLCIYYCRCKCHHGEGIFLILLVLCSCYSYVINLIGQRIPCPLCTKTCAIQNNNFFLCDVVQNMCVFFFARTYLYAANVFNVSASATYYCILKRWLQHCTYITHATFSFPTPNLITSKVINCTSPYFPCILFWWASCLKSGGRSHFLVHYFMSALWAS